ncbi:MAG: hypothetical protein HKN88_08300 [Gammaproteobacteria bacterium]|nr:hypothetical protein [Gammaproteobacteria bacterium]NNC98061.1 hypothetical protein [Gammaproteobacteria bacterium]NNM14611.1 hypothetical protein [Gammaproteobacteria bacterium]
MSAIEKANASLFGFLGDNEETAIAKVHAVILQVIDAHTRCDYEKFSTLCTDEFIDQIDEEVFTETCNDMNPRFGPLETLEYLGSLQRVELVQFLWRGHFHDADEEILITASFAKAKNIPLVEWLWIE